MLIKKLGFEIRKLGDMKTFYRDVDTVLANANVPTAGVNADLQVSTVAHSLQRMISNESQAVVTSMDFQPCSHLRSLFVSL